MKPPFAYGLNLYRMKTQNLNITYKMLLRKQNVKYRLYLIFFVFCARHSYFLMKSQSFVNSLFNTNIHTLTQQTIFSAPLCVRHCPKHKEDQDEKSISGPWLLHPMRRQNRQLPYTVMRNILELY